MSGTGAKMRSIRVLTSGSVGSGSSHMTRKALSGAKLSSNGVTLKSSRSGQVVGQFNSMDTNEEASDSKGVSNSKINTLQAKCFNNGVVIGSPFSSINYDMEKEEEVSLSFCMSFSLDKVWIDPKIIKTQVEIVVKKFFTLDINFLAVEEKSATAKTQVIRILFSRINGFGGATTSSKFEKIIRSTFTSKKSMKKAVSLAGENKIIVNTNLKKQEVHSDWAVVIKEIPMNTSKDMIVAAKAVVEFAESSQADVLASKWSFLIRKDSVRVAKAVRDHDIWAFRDCFRVLLFTLLVRTTAHDLSNLLDNTGGKTCVINHLLNTGNRVYCAVVGFESENDLNSAFLTKPVFGGVHLSWARLDLVQCRKCGRFGHLALKCDASDMSSFDLLSSFIKTCVSGVDRFWLAKLYAKKNVPISRPAAFGGKSWAQVVSLAFSSGGSPSGSSLGVGFSSPATSGLGDSSPFSTITDFFLNAHLASLKCFFKLLANQVSDILRKLSFVELVPMVPSAGAPLLVGSVSLVPVLNSNMALNSKLTSSTPHLPNADLGAGFSSSSSKVLTTKMGGLESKMSALKAFVNFVLASALTWKIATCNVQGINVPMKQVDVFCWHIDSGLTVSFIKDKFDGVRIFTFGLDIGFFGAGVAIIMNNSLACHVSKVEKVSGWVITVQLLFRNKLSVFIIGLYTGASSGVCFGQASEVNSLIAKAINSSIFVVLGGNFNKNGSERNASFKFCSGLGLVNSLGGRENLVSAVADHRVGSVSDFFDTDHNAVMVSIGLDGLLDV
ncbi:hypothetical protein G9A89_013528 [Geosiphon pyriformis]|nr:hypothetical protein G9A89_013528 [Geosiphon pyriformis]